MTLVGEETSNQHDNEIEKWQSCDNSSKKTRFSNDAAVSSGFRKSKSDLELSKCTRSTDMGSQLNRPRSFHDFEMLEDQKPSLPNTSDYSDDDYLPLDSTDDDIQTEDEVNHDSSAPAYPTLQSDRSQVQSYDLDDVSSDTGLSGTRSTNGNLCSSFTEVSPEIQSRFHSDTNGNDSGNISENTSELRKDLTWKCMTLPKTNSYQRCPGFQRSMRQIPYCERDRNDRNANRGASGNGCQVPKLNANNENELHRSMEKIETCGSLQNHLPNNGGTVFPSESANEAVQSRVSDPDVFNVVLLEQQLSADPTRPRQYGRRSNPVRISSFAIESSDNGAARIIAHHHQNELRRPISAPIHRSFVPENSSQRRRECLPSEVSSLDSSRNSSPVSVASSSDSSIADPIDAINSRIGFVSSTNLRSNEIEEEDHSNDSKDFWPHSLSRPLATVCSTLGLFNVSRCAIFTIYFGANFLVQFLILSFIFGIPLLWLQMCLGQKIKGGIVTLFKITPICKGIGVALMISHCIITLYSSVSIGWLMIYIRHSFVSNGNSYKWEDRFESFRGHQNGTTSTELSENIADFWNFVVLQRHTNLYEGNQMKFQLAFNVSVVWTLVFILLSRGIRSLGQIVIGTAILSFSGLSIVCIKLLTLLSFETVQDIFPATDWQDFFANSSSWSVAAQESFLTWGLLGVSVYSIYCKSDRKTAQPFVLRREAFLIVFLTFFGLFLGAILGSTSVILLKLNGLNYYPASFESPKTDIFLWPAHQAVATGSNFHSIPLKSIPRFSTVIGESFEKITKLNGIYVVKETGFKPIRLVTEILPATLAVSEKIEPCFGYIAFLSLFLLGLAQLAVMWKPIAAAIGSNTSAILLSCITGLFLGFPLITENGIVIAHYLDYIFGGAWWLLVLWTSFIVAIFLIRGSPFTSDVLAKELKFNETFSVFLAFSWNVLVPLALIMLSVIEYRKSHSRELFNNRSSTSDHLSMWPNWAKLLGGVSQLSLLMVVPIVSVVQMYMYLSKGPSDILERIELLFRPPMEPRLHAPVRRLYPQTSSQPEPVALQVESNNERQCHVNDVPPPKYSPPPSYGRATGARIAKVLRNSIRRSVRRFRRGEGNRSEGPSSNIPSISSRVQRPNEPSQSVENLLMSDLSLDHDRY